MNRRMNMLNESSQKAMEEFWKLREEALHILDLVVVEWSTDPMSVQCFDLRIVERAKTITKRMKAIKESDDGGFL